MLNLFFRFPSKVGVRQGRDERDRRAGHLALLRLALPDGAGVHRPVGVDHDHDGTDDLDDPHVRRGGGGGRSLLRRRAPDHSSVQVRL